MATILGIDWGQKRVGVARADTTARLSEPLVTLAYTTTDELIDKLQKLAIDYQAQTVVVGVPRNLDGEYTQQSQAIEAFISRLDKILDCQVVRFDETLSSAAGEDIKTQYSNSDRDSRAAAVILQDYLDSM